MKRAIDEYLTCNRCKRLFEEASEGCIFERLICRICCREIHRHGARSATVSTIPTLTRDQVQEFLEASGYDPARIAEALQHPDGIRLTVPEVGEVALIRVGDRYEIAVLDEREKALKEKNRMSKHQPCLIVGPALVYDGPAPLGPKKAMSLQDEILAKSGTYLLKSDRRPFDPNSRADIAAHVQETLKRFPGARLASAADTPAKALSEKLDRTLGREPEPKVLVKMGAEPVAQGRIAGTISRQALRESIAASERQAEEVHDRVRARQAAENSMPAQRSDGSFYGADGKTPHEPLSMSRQPEDRDPERGVGPLSRRYKADELSPVMRALVKGVRTVVCEVNGCSTQIQSATRKRCGEHAMSDFGMGLKEK